MIKDFGFFYDDIETIFHYNATNALSRVKNGGEFRFLADGDAWRNFISFNTDAGLQDFVELMKEAREQRQ